MTTPELPRGSAARGDAGDGRAVSGSSRRSRSRTSRSRSPRSIANRIASPTVSRRSASPPATGMALYLPNCPQYELAFYAASKLGAISCPMNPSYREREITYQVNDSGAKVHGDPRKPVAGRRCVPSATPELSRASSSSAIARSTAAASRSRTTRCVDSGSRRRAGCHGRSASAGGAALFERHHRSAEGRDAHASHPGLQPGAVSATRSGIGPDDAFPIFLPLSHIYGVMLMNAALGVGRPSDLDGAIRSRHARDERFRSITSRCFISCRQCCSRWPMRRDSTDRSSATVRYALSRGGAARAGCRAPRRGASRRPGHPGVRSHGDRACFTPLARSSPSA